MTNRLAALFLASALASLGGCAHLGPGRRVAAVDPAPFLASLRPSQGLWGLSATADLDYRGRGRRFDGSAYLLTGGDGRFRVEVPGAWGSTMLVLVSDGATIWAYYPEQAIVYRGTLEDGAYLDRLPFPLPAQPGQLPCLLAGTLPPGIDTAAARAFELANGQVELVVPAAGGEARYSFSRRPAPALLVAAFEGPRGSMTVAFADSGSGLPSRFTSRSAAGTLRGTLTAVRVVEDPPVGSFGPPHPPNAAVRDLGGLP